MVTAVLAVEAFLEMQTIESHPGLPGVQIKKMQLFYNWYKWNGYENSFISSKPN